MIQYQDLRQDKNPTFETLWFVPYQHFDHRSVCLMCTFLHPSCCVSSVIFLIILFYLYNVQWSLIALKIIQFTVSF